MAEEERSRQAFERQPDTGLNTAEITTYWSTDIPANSNVERVLNYEQPSGQSQGPKGNEGDPGITYISGAPVINGGSGYGAGVQVHTIVAGVIDFYPLGFIVSVSGGSITGKVI